MCGRPTRTWDPVTGTRNFRYNTAGRLITAVDAAGQVHRYTWDKRGRLVTTTNAAALTGPGIAGGDRLILKLDAVSEQNKLDVNIKLTAPVGGVVATMGSLKAPLTATVDENFVWFLFAALPIAILGGALAAVLGIVGLVIAFTRKAGYAWPIIGTVLGLVVAIVLFIWASG